MDNKCVICGKEPLLDKNTEGIITFTLPDKSTAACCLSHKGKDLQEYVSQFVKPSELSQHGDKVYLNQP